MSEHDPVDWYVRNMACAKRPITLTDDQARCLRVLSSISITPNTIYNLPCATNSPLDAIVVRPMMVSALIHGELATFDGDALTRLVEAAHRERVRVSIRAWRPNDDDPRAKLIADYINGEYEMDVEPDDPSLAVGVMDVWCHPRKAEGSGYERHPGLDRFAVVDA